MCTYVLFICVVEYPQGANLEQGTGRSVRIRTGLHLALSTSSDIGIAVNALEAGNVGMPQLSLLHLSLCLATVKSSAKPMIET